MSKGKMLNIDPVKQETENDCWICCTVMIHNFYFPRQKMLYGSELSGKRIIPSAIQKYIDLKGIGEDGQASAVDCLSYVDHFSDKIDEWALPTFEDVAKAIDENVPLLCMIGTTKPRNKKPEQEYTGGHWTVLVGYEEGDEGRFLHFVDPDINRPSFLWVKYPDDCQYAPNDQGDALYVESTTYVEYREKT